MTITKHALFVLGLGLPLSAASAQIIRHPGPAQSPILASVTIPAGSTLLLLSGQIPSAIDPTKPAGSFEAFGDTKTQATSVSQDRNA